MLTYEALTEQAVLRGMPATKMRAALREYLQVLILKEIYRSEAGRKLYFTGGTYLRLVHSLKRFSEDLDFNTQSMRKNEFEDVVKKAGLELKRRGLDCQVEWAHWGNLYAAKIIFTAIEKGYRIVSRYSKKEGISIKVETNRPKWKIKRESGVVSGFGEFCPVNCTDRAALFADKVDALVKKNRARHLYDIFFMLSNRYPIDKGVLNSLGIKADPLEVIVNRVLSLSPAELKRQAENLRPFLFNEEEADLLVHAHDTARSLIQAYRQ